MDKLTYHMTLTLLRQEKCFGPGPMQLLRGVEKSGSLHQSAAEMGMSYSKAWNILRMLEKQWGFALLNRQAGGRQGGGSTLTDEGKKLLTAYESWLRDVEEYAGKSFEKYFQGELYLGLDE